MTSNHPGAVRRVAARVATAPLLLFPLLVASACGPGADAGGGRPAAADAAAYDERGVTHAAAGEHERAVAAFDSALAVDPDHVSALSNRGVAYFQLARWDEALADFDRVLQLRPEAAKSWYDRAYVLDVKGEFERAEADLTRAIELDSAFADAWLNRGIVRARGDDPAGALADFTRAIELEPSATAFKDRGIAHFQEGRFRDAVADFSEVIRREPAQARHYLRRGRAYRGLGDLARAEADYRRLLELTGNPEIRKQAIDELREIGAL